MAALMVLAVIVPFFQQRLEGLIVEEIPERLGTEKLNFYCVQRLHETVLCSMTLIA